MKSSRHELLPNNRDIPGVRAFKLRYRGTSLIRKRLPLGLYSKPLPRGFFQARQPYHQAAERAQITFSSASICAISRRIPDSVIQNPESEKGNLIPLRGLVMYR